MSGHSHQAHSQDSIPQSLYALLFAIPLAFISSYLSAAYLVVFLGIGLHKSETGILWLIVKKLVWFSFIAMVVWFIWTVASIS